MVLPLTRLRVLAGFLMAVLCAVACGRGGYDLLTTVAGGDNDLRPCVSASSPACVDSIFSNDGIFVTDIGGIDNVQWSPHGLDIDSADRLLVVIDGGTAANVDFGVVRLLESGVPDASFGIAGVALVDTGSPADHAQAVRVQPDGNIVVAGTCDDKGCAARVTPKGGLDTTFNNTGVRVIDSAPGWEVINDVVLLQNGHMRFCGQGATTVAGAPTDLYLTGLLANGADDTQFGTSGVMSIDAAGSDEFGGAMTLDASERILVTGNSLASASFDFILARVDSGTGTPDATFNNGVSAAGRVTLDFFGFQDSCSASAVLGDGRIICAGGATDAAGTPLFAVARYLSSGVLDNSFAVLGYTTYALHGGINALLVLPGGRVLLGGNATNANGDNDFALAMITADGSLDPTFGTGGTALIDVTPGADDGIHAMMLDRLGRVVIMGHTTNATNDLVVMRIWL